MADYWGEALPEERRDDVDLFAAISTSYLLSLLSVSSGQDTGGGATGFQTTFPAVSLSYKYSHQPLSPPCEAYHLRCMPPFIVIQSKSMHTPISRKNFMSPKNLCGT
jgi:hypothetical protein